MATLTQIGGMLVDLNSEYERLQETNTRKIALVF